MTTVEYIVGLFCGAAIGYGLYSLYKIRKSIDVLARDANVFEQNMARVLGALSEPKIAPRIAAELGLSISDVHMCIEKFNKHSRTFIIEQQEGSMQYAIMLRPMPPDED